MPAYFIYIRRGFSAIFANHSYLSQKLHYFAYLYLHLLENTPFLRLDYYSLLWQFVILQLFYNDAIILFAYTLYNRNEIFLFLFSAFITKYIHTDICADFGTEIIIYHYSHFQRAVLYILHIFSVLPYFLRSVDLYIR